MLLTGFFWILQKIEAESDLNRDSFIFYAHLGMIPVGLFAWFMRPSWIDFSIESTMYPLFLSLIYVFIFKLRLIALEYLDSSSYFINYRIISATFLIIFWQIIFWEIITISEYIWILLWFVIFYLLIEKKGTEKWRKHFWQGILYVVIWAILLSIIWLAQKWYTISGFNPGDFILFSGISWTISSLLFRSKKTKLKDVLILNKKHILLLLLVFSIFPFGCLFNIYAIKAWWDVAIVYKIVSYSLFIPIIYSIIIYKEEINIRKIFAFILTIISIALFM